MTYTLKQQNNKVDCGENVWDLQNLTTSKTQTDKNENLIQISVFRDSPKMIFCCSTEIRPLHELKCTSTEQNNPTLTINWHF